MVDAPLQIVPSLFAVPEVSLKVIGDHVRAVVHMISDDIIANNEGRGYVLRRLIRRVVRHGRLIGINNDFTAQVAETAIALSESAYPKVRQKAETIKNELQKRLPELEVTTPQYRDFRAADVRHSLASIKKASQLLGYKPTHTIRQGMAEAMDWYVQDLMSPANQ